ncbi:MAG TPA: ROK family protein [Acidimicrobiia bacterium]|nr:ROK family protein [Acidimicrobiia bacterium]HIL06885.1 ROK family protein [Acidimicrobiia bacterium]
MPSNVALALDVGGTKFAAGLVTDDGDVVAKKQVPTAQTSRSDDLFATLLELANDVLGSNTEVVVCGVGCGGPMVGSGEAVSPLNIPAWREFPLRERLREGLGMDVHIDNDAKALALGEAWFGAGRNFSNFLAMVVSTGIGGGVFVDGRLLDGGDGNAGHIGHVIVEPEGADCACGSRGCLEAEASGPAISRRLGADPSTAGVQERRRAGMLVGRAVASAVTLLDLEHVLIGGSVALGFGDEFFDAANMELFERCHLDFSRGVKISPVGLGAEAPLVGAAVVGFRSLGIDARTRSI